MNDIDPPIGEFATRIEGEVFPGYMTTQEVMAALEVCQQRVSQIARDRHWQKKKVGRSNLYKVSDVLAEMERRGTGGFGGEEPPE